MQSPHLSVTDTICVHFYFLVSRTGMGGIKFPSIFVYDWSHSMFIMWAMCGLTYVTVVALCSCSTQKYIERWPAALNEVGWSLLMKGHKILSIELNTVHFYQHYPFFMHNKLQYTSRGNYCECVRPGQLPILTLSSSSIPLGATSTIRSTLGPRRIQHHIWVQECMR